MTRTQRTFLSRIRGKTLWTLIAILVLAAGGGFATYTKISSTNRNANSSQLQTAIAQRGNLVLSTTGTGTLIANSDATFGFETSGQVKAVYVKVGDQVQAGQVLAQLDDTLAQMKYTEAQQALLELHSAASIAAVQKEIGTAQDTESQARRWLAYLISPDVVEAQDNLAIAQQKLADAEAAAKATPSDAANLQVKESQAAVTYLQQKLDQTWAYFKNTYAPETFGEYINVGSRRHPKQALDTYTDPYTGEELPKIDWPSTDDIAKAQNNYAQAQQTIQDDETYLNVLTSGVIPEGATGEKIKTLYEAQVAADEAKLALEATKLVAPISGTITSLDLNLGEQAGTSSVVTISQLNQPYTLDAYLDETGWKMAQVGNQVNVMFDLLSDQTFPGKITLVYPELNTSSNSPTVHILVQLDQSISQNLPAGMGATVEVVEGEADGVLLVPVGALKEVGGGKYAVDVIQNGGQVQQEIELGLKNDSYAEVKAGLQAGEIVVTK